MDNINRNIDVLKAIFPDCIQMCEDEDGTVKEKLNLDKFRQMLGEDNIAEPEHYEFSWEGKKNALAKADTPANAKLCPVKEESIDWDSTGNMFIEGDNLTVLKLLQEKYLGAIKMIYIDPPYNTGGDFIYDDNFRIHSDWCSMIYPRLILARKLLADDGVIFISLDDNEQANMRKICDEVFGESNFIAQCVRKRRNSQANLSKNISPIHEYLFIYAKKNGNILNRIKANIDEGDYKNPDNDPRGAYKTMPCTNKGGAVYTITTPTGREITDEWRFKPDTYYSLLNDNRIVFPREGEGKPRYKLFLSEKMENGQLANTWLDNLATNQEATRELKAIFGDRVVFETPKPLGLLKFCMELATDKDSIVLDFFAGSCSTAHAVMQMNAEDGGDRKYIMVQIDESCNKRSIAYKHGFPTVSAIGKERIRLVSESMKKDGITGDLGVRVYKVETINV